MGCQQSPKRSWNIPPPAPSPPSGRITPFPARIPCLFIWGQTICVAENVRLWAERPSGTCAHHIGSGIKGDLPGEGKVTQLGMERREGTSQAGCYSAGENKTWVQLPLHVAPTPPGSGVFFCLFTVCITKIWSQFGQFYTWVLVKLKQKWKVLPRKTICITVCKCFKSLLVFSSSVIHHWICHLITRAMWEHLCFSPK